MDLYSSNLVSLSVWAIIHISTLVRTGNGQENALWEHLGDQKINMQATVRRGFRNGGFHRELTTEIVIHIQGSTSQTSPCEILVIEDLPRDIYVDIDQVRQNRKWGDPHVVSQSRIDVEKPAYRSREHRVHIFGVARNENEFIRTNVSIPIHLRYQRPSSEKSHVIIMLKQPKILSRCADGTLLGFGTEVSAPCDRKDLKQSCSWTDLPFQVKEGAVLTFKIPVGMLQYTALVTAGTLASTLLGTTLLLFAIYRSGNPI